MQKPWGLKAIEFLLYVQIGLAFIVSSYGILFLIVREVLTFQQLFFDRMPELSQVILNRGYGGWTFLIRLLSLGLLPMPVAGAEFILCTAIFLFFEFIVSGVILFVLKTKSLDVIRRTVGLVLFTKITSGGAIVLSGLPISIFTLCFSLCSILAVAFLSLKPAQYSMVATIAIIVRTVIIAFNENQNYPSIGFIPSHSNIYIFFFISVLFTILTSAFLFIKPVQYYHYIRSRSRKQNNSVGGN